MGDNYYGQQYPQGSHQRDPYSQSAYAPPPSGYSTYQPPTDDGYRGSPVPPNLQVAQYDDRHRRSGDFGSRPRSRHSDGYREDDRYSDRSGHYLPPPSPNSRRPSSRGSNREREHKDHHEAKSIGATILGGVAGALIGRKAGHRDILPTVLGGVAGAWGGHKIEEEFSERRNKSHERRHEGDLAYGGRGRERRRSDESDESDRKSFREKVKDRIRSLSRKRSTDDRERSRSVGRRRRDDSVDSYDSKPSNRHSGRYGSEGRDRYERDGRHDRDYY